MKLWLKKSRTSKIIPSCLTITQHNSVVLHFYGILKQNSDWLIIIWLLFTIAYGSRLVNNLWRQCCIRSLISYKLWCHSNTAFWLVSNWQCSGSLTIWCGSGFETFFFDHKDVNKKLTFKKRFSAHYFLKVYLHHFSKIKSPKKSKNSRIKVFLSIFAWW
jgi:hypothetical protein